MAKKMKTIRALDGSVAIFGEPYPACGFISFYHKAIVKKEGEGTLSLIKNFMQFTITA